MATCPALERDVLEETYLDLQRMVIKIVSKAHKRYGGDWDELMSEANRLFVLACKRHDPKRGSITTCVYIAVMRGLNDRYRRECKRLKGCHEISLDSIQMGEEDERHIEIFIKELQDTASDIKHLLMEISDDAKCVVDLVLFPPRDLQEEIKACKNSTIKRRCIEEYLRFTLKWTRFRIRKVVQELREALD